mmetsp:Transcript_43536/g.98403  ORF Transcript_43536/g.98403 Transcript_43536/m.98403 type:complete len:129 (-) Transcript_43536:93-479(-)|eukprot:CAMPEP_0181168176 /NCGR_PEP_ID=MMETSP1096-20121128/124_1 /TAXON_ID=156174 ORGANISM="Chrysochromulina ericina, Strain CCMP281" /NCGR_SAMPLE_ID=MMETSP1096 /ASSEMBLY_ACC=CAM_ASM_000453 /LENGTH=128 /DNA_ID=CAMNT_0023255515 /DNA_START=100 /DNA_END=486 /DNA_ORIENTATION=+
MSEVNEEAAKAKARELESAISERVRKVQQEQAHLEQLSKQVKSMEILQMHGIEQLRTEIVKVNASLGHWQDKMRAAEQRLATSTELMQRCQDTKRYLSERLLEMLLESEEARQERLQSVEQTLETIEG